MKALYLAAVTALMFTPALAQTTGQGGPVIQGSAGPAGTTDASRVEKCDHPFGALAVLEPQDFMERELIRYGLQSPTQPLRLIVQQSNCFTVVERGMALRSLQQERDLQRAGELRSGLSMGKPDDRGGLRADPQDQWHSNLRRAIIVGRGPGDPGKGR